MASLDECRQALEKLGERMTESTGDNRSPSLERSISCALTDLGATFTGKLLDGRLTDISTEPGEQPAQIRLTMTSDDLLALVDGDLAIASAWASGRIKIDASFMDLMKLRSMIG